MRLLRADEEFQGFRRVTVEAHRRHPLRILAYCILSNHWQFVLLPRAGGQVTDYFRWMAHAHGMRWRRKQLAATSFRLSSSFRLRAAIGSDSDLRLWDVAEVLATHTVQAADR
jgi:hypothetical protein